MGYAGLTRWALVIGCWIPVIGLFAVLLYVSFTEWPVHEDLEKLKQGYRR